MQLPEPPKPPASKGKVVLAIIAPLVVLLVGCPVLYWAFKLAAAPVSPVSPAALETRPPTPTGPPRKITIVAPDKLGGRTKNTDPEIIELVSEKDTNGRDLPGVTDVMSNAYGSIAKKNLILVFAMTVNPSPLSKFDDLLRNVFTSPDIKIVKPLIEYDPGPLGGRAQCGEANSSGTWVAVCIWADEGSLGGIMWVSTSVEEARAEFHAIRAAIEQVA